MPFESIGRKLKELRLARGITLNDAAEQLEIPASNLCDIEAGRRWMRSYVIGLGALLGPEVFVLMAEEERDRAEAEALAAMAAQMTARFERAATEFLAEGYPGVTWAWLEDAEEVAAELAGRPERHRLLLEHQAKVAAALTPELLAERTGLRLGEYERQIAEKVCARWRDLLTD